MATEDAEKGVKGPTLSQGITTDAGETGSVQADALQDPSPYFRLLSRKPGLLRRSRFAAEHLLQAFADNWLEDCGQRNARFLWSATVMSFGAASYYTLPDEPSFLFLLVLTIGLVAVLGLRLRKGLTSFPLLLVAMGTLGLTAASYHGSFSGTPILTSSFTATITGVLERVERRSNGDRTDERWTVRVESISKVARNDMPVRVLLIRKAKGERYYAGQRLRMRARLLPLQRPAFPGAFDYGRYLWARSIGAQGYLSKSIKLLPQNELGGFAALSDWWKTSIEQTRQAVARYLEGRLGGEAAGLGTALAVGKRDRLDREVEDALRHSGLAHILAISGLHMALVTVSVFWGARSLLALIPTFALRYPIKQWAAALALLAGTAYLMLSGFSVATIRAYFMTSIFLMATLMGRQALTMHNLALAMVFVVLVQPYGTVEAGMQMSFAATAALIATYDRIRWFRAGLSGRGQQVASEPTGQMRGVLQSSLFWFVGIGMTSLIAGVAVLPFSISHFQQMAPLGLVANLLVMPVVSLIVMPMGLLTVLLTPIGLQSVPLVGVELGLDWVIAMAKLVSSYSDARALVVRGAGLSMSLVVLALAIFAIHRRKLAVLAFIPLGLALIFWSVDTRPSLWVSEKGNKVAYRDGSGDWQLLGSSRMTLAYNALLRSDGDVRALGEAHQHFDLLESTSELADPETGCDRDACFVDDLVQVDGLESDLSVAIIRHPSAFAEECGRRVIIVTKLDVPSDCQQPTLILGRQALAAGGARLIDFEQKGRGFDPVQFVRERLGYDARITMPSRTQGDWILRVRRTVPPGQRPWITQAD